MNPSLSINFRKNQKKTREYIIKNEISEYYLRIEIDKEYIYFILSKQNEGLEYNYKTKMDFPCIKEKLELNQNLNINSEYLLSIFDNNHKENQLSIIEKDENSFNLIITITNKLNEKLNKEITLYKDDTNNNDKFNILYNLTKQIQNKIKNIKDNEEIENLNKKLDEMIKNIKNKEEEFNNKIYEKDKIIKEMNEKMNNTINEIINKRFEEIENKFNKNKIDEINQKELIKKQKDIIEEQKVIIEKQKNIIEENKNKQKKDHDEFQKIKKENEELKNNNNKNIKIIQKKISEFSGKFNSFEKRVKNLENKINNDNKKDENKLIEEINNKKEIDMIKKETDILKDKIYGFTDKTKEYFENNKIELIKSNEIINKLKNLEILEHSGKLDQLMHLQNEYKEIKSILCNLQNSTRNCKYEEIFNKIKEKYPFYKQVNKDKIIDIIKKKNFDLEQSTKWSNTINDLYNKFNYDYNVSSLIEDETFIEKVNELDLDENKIKEWVETIL